MAGRKHRADPRTTRDNGGMDIYLNGDVVSLSDSTRTITALLLEQDLGERRVAVEVNGEIVPRGRHGEHRLQPGDRVEIVHALGGG
ncbi:sulfur carrier protein [Luteimonas cucumeris]|uniref:Sulfur carrier protein n=2 Tax=Luteimonas cucumeris TaxID=985012 RepID=A0A562LF77_9GAMM|nr:sulfur carrier protein [Luteimonas cucumeris]